MVVRSKAVAFIAIPKHGGFYVETVEVPSEVLRRAATPEDACAALIQAALHSGGKDNVTVALARYHFEHFE